MELGALRLHYLRIMNTPEIIDSTDRLHLEVDKDLKIKEAHIECFQEIPDWFLRRLADIRTEQDAKFRKRDDDLELRLVARSEEHTSELQSLMRISYAVFCLKK